MRGRMAGLKSARRARQEGWPQLHEAWRMRRVHSNARARLGLISPGCAERRRARGEQVGDLRYLVEEYGAKLAEAMVVRYLVSPTPVRTRIRGVQVDLRARGLTWGEARARGLIRTPLARLSSRSCTTGFKQGG
jgi:hypothetical protein